ncbi:hypothetical protein OFDDKENP_00257 [Aeromonas phage B614]|nr:hypothetical protein OFDDKENP_00257 [Aeromonas phage B614]UYD58266.1 hypothetical protein JNEOFJEA_00187 [Aeromonas phage UP87]UYD58380.1 hypothetical protein IPAKJDPM_00037 [Aeromonas phage avDM14-QBC]UYD58596.1 hypothetical protein HNNIDBEH_00003 [Aeromonas phage avDM10-HWA]UYD59101.1 hypothetical protein OFOPOMKI_00251 [Aeromonas phage avDM7-IJDJ]UYD59913.1 hypothetical protein LEHPIFIF_00140 [Aeromonas phage avDM9-HANS]
MNCMKRFTLGITDDKYLVSLDGWHKEQDFAERVIRQFNNNTTNIEGLFVKGMSGWPTKGYLRDMTRNFMMKRYGWTAMKDYRSWCRQNKDQILVLEVFGENDEDDNVNLEMKYTNDGFLFKLC